MRRLLGFGPNMIAMGIKITTSPGDGQFLALRGDERTFLGEFSLPLVSSCERRDR
jgi:hypothetical protein